MSLSKMKMGKSWQHYLRKLPFLHRWKLGFQRVIFEGDAASVIKALSMRDLALALIGHLVKDFMSIAGSLRTFSFSRTRRQDNNVAHALVRGVSFSFSCKFGWRMFHQIFYIMLLKIFQLIK